MTQGYSCGDRLGGFQMLPVAVDKVRMMVQNLRYKSNQLIYQIA